MKEGWKDGGKKEEGIAGHNNNKERRKMKGIYI